MIHTKKIRACALAIVQLLLLLSLSCNVAIYDDLYEPEGSIFISSITPNSGMEPNLVFITDLIGGFFMPGATVMLSRAGFTDIIAADVTVLSGSHITCEIDLTGSMTGQWDVVVTNPDGASAVLTEGFTVSWDAPLVTGITPSSGLEPNTVSITDLAGDNFKPGATVRLTMAGQPDIIATGVNVLSETQITCDIDLAGVMFGQWNVVVTNTDLMSGALPNGFTVDWPPPTISGITPNAGNEPDTVAITNLAGTYFKTGAEVRLTRAGYLDIIATGVNVVDQTQITCSIDLADAAFGQWNVVVINPGPETATLPNGFTVSWDAPVVTGITPSSGLEPNSYFISDLAGSNFNPGAEVRLTKAGQPDIIATMVTVVSDTQITCGIDLSGAMFGQWNVVVTNTDLQSGTLPNGFTVTWSSPTITGVNPNQLIWLNDSAISDITGTEFKDGVEVRLTKAGQTDIVAHTVTLGGPTQIRSESDVLGAADGLWNVRVTNIDGGFAVLTDGLTINAPLSTTFTEDWESGTDGWIDTVAGGDTWGTSTTYHVSGSYSLRMIAATNWDYFDGVHYVFAGGFQPGNISFRIRKDWDQSVHPHINIGGDTTTSDGGAIYFYWDSFGPFHMAVAGGGSVFADYQPFHFVEFRNINFTTQTFDFYVDGSPVTIGVPFNAPVSSFTRLYISVGWWAQGGYIDDIQMWP